MQETVPDLLFEEFRLRLYFECVIGVLFREEKCCFEQSLAVRCISLPRVHINEKICEP